MAFFHLNRLFQLFVQHKTKFFKKITKTDFSSCIIIARKLYIVQDCMIADFF